MSPQIAQKRSPQAHQTQTQQLIEVVVKGLEKASYFKGRLEDLAGKNPDNCRMICDYVLFEVRKFNIKPMTRQIKIQTLVAFSAEIGHIDFRQVSQNQVLVYLTKTQKSHNEDPKQAWISTYNTKLQHLSKFYKYIFAKDLTEEKPVPECLEGIEYMQKESKSVYEPQDMWDDECHSTFLRYCPSVKDKAYHAMAMDLAARPSEILNVKIKDITFKVTALGKQYATVQLTGKTGTRTLPLTDSIPYLKEWLMRHPTAANRESWLFITESTNHFGKKMNRDALYQRYTQFYEKRYLRRLLEDETVPAEDKERIKKMLAHPFCPYIFRHSGLTKASRVLKEFELRKFAGWTVNSDMPQTYVHLSNEVTDTLLKAKGILTDEDDKTANLLESKTCTNCNEINRKDAHVCLKCRMPLTINVIFEMRSQMDKLVAQLVNEKIKHMNLGFGIIGPDASCMAKKE